MTDFQIHQNLNFCGDSTFCFADTEKDFELISNLSNEIDKYKFCTQASHAMIFTKSINPVLKMYDPKALITMQSRFDGYLGFPGGVVDSGEDAASALNRELAEEMGLAPLMEFKMKDRVFVHFNKSKSLLLHFFLKEVPTDVFREVELKSVKAPEFGNEVLGVLRVPLYTMNDGYRGFPAFLQNKFIGNSRQQLLECLKLLKLMTAEEIEHALKAKPLYLKKS